MQSARPLSISECEFTELFSDLIHKYSKYLYNYKKYEKFKKKVKADIKSKLKKIFPEKNRYFIIDVHIYKINTFFSRVSIYILESDSYVPGGIERIEDVIDVQLSNSDINFEAPWDF